VDLFAFGMWGKLEGRFLAPRSAKPRKPLPVRKPRGDMLRGGKVGQKGDIAEEQG